ncbi:gluconokinase [Neiella marina]|uniref:Gluconokinase n=1 Tax=Neiella holothuriorum TaxID=2870530 RepID=A0ABS7EHU0_9GAMM|nr:gluconokinase [Neiella holothuriorum]MBW8191913.1 gluconokinase [Neiella holothuriorum]
MIVIVAGVSGTGKSTVGERVAHALALPFYDADDFHPQCNVDKMRGGTPLTDDDRWPWLDRLATLLAECETTGGAVLACSALKEKYRQRLMSECSDNIQWITLNGDYDLLKQRMSERQDHFFDGTLLQSQLATLELPDYGHIIDVSPRLDEVVSHTLKQLP